MRDEHFEQRQLGLPEDGLNSASELPKAVTSKAIFPDWPQFALGIGLLVVATVFDANRPLDRAWSILYFLVAFYAACFLRGRAELLFYGIVLLVTFLTPILSRPDMRLFNRAIGAIAGIVAIAILRDRRRIIASLEQSNRNLESLVDSRTSALKASHQRLESLSRQLIKTQETERTQLAHELHDEIGQVLTAMKLNLRRLQPDANFISGVQENIEMIDDAVDRVRNLTLHLHPPQLSHLGLAAALHWFIKHKAKIAGFQERITVIPPSLQVPPDLGLVCFRITQEAVTNAVKHAEPKCIEVEVRQLDSELILVVRDDGRGFDVSRVADVESGRFGMGLSGMRERVMLAGGNFQVESEPGRGTTIQVRFPFTGEPNVSRV